MSFTSARIVGKSVDPVEYLSIPDVTERGHADYPMSSTTLRNFGSCPSRFRSGYIPPDSKAKGFGRLLDCMDLTADQFTKRYAIQPLEYVNEDGDKKKWNNNAQVCREWKQLRVAEGKEVVTMTDVKACEAAVARLRSDDILNAFLLSSDCQVWVQGDWQDEATGLSVPCRCLIDCVPRLDTEFAKALGDLKTTRNGSLMVFQRWCFQAGYHVQAAFDMDLYVAATGEDRVSWCWLVQENFEPWETARRLCSQDLLTLGRATYQRLLANYCQCLKSGKWPSYDDHDEAAQGWSIVEPEPFMAEKEAFAPHFQFEEPEE